ncbi:DNA polymerase III subunit gamma and tau [Pseudonocardia sp.]|uniref:DNA polymerase III subunit gamma and tau n=1 Tax=Pseudonocardia sp. TaxID=60912 RepID=UPI0031FCA71E
MALALYRKYRPAKFAEVVGQEHVTEPLGTALTANRINHAYLFSGPRGCGKTSSARILARSLNCVQGPTPDPCGVCDSCIALAPEGPGSIDVVELDAASHGGVDDARELRDRAFYAPAESRYRVFIVDEAHMVTTQGFNALLKIVEEPPEHLVFIFATTEPDKVLPTIRSRTHHYPFRLIPPGTLRALLERICADEGVLVAPAVYPLVIRAGGGSARDTLSVLDQLLAGAGPEGVTYERAMALLGVTDVALIDDVVDALAAADGASVYEAVDRLVEAGHDPRRFAADLLQRLRDLMLVQAVPDAGAQGLVDAADDELNRMTEQAARLGPATLARYGEIVHGGLTEMRGATAPRLLLELLCARMLLPAATTSDSALLERLERLERRNAIAPEPTATAGGEGADTGARRQFVRPAERARGQAPEPTPEAAGAPIAQAPAEQARPAQTVSPVAQAEDPAAGAAAAPAAAEPAPSGDAPRPAAAAAPGSGEATGPVAAERPAEPPRSVEAPSAPAPVAAPAREPSRVEQPPPTPAPAAASAALPTASTDSTSGLDAGAVRRVWSEILAAARQRSRSTEALMVNATVRAVQDDTLVLAIGSPPLARRLSDPRNTDVIVEALRAVLGVQWRVRCESGDGGVPAAAPPRARAAAPQRQAPQRASRTEPQRPSEQAQPQPGPSYERPSRPEQPQRPDPRRRSGTDESGIPLPPEPPADEPPPDDEEAMLAEAATSRGEQVVRRDPEEAAIELLASQLGASTIEPR